MSTLAGVVSSFSDALDFVLHQRESVSGGVKVGGSELLPQLGEHLKVTALAMAFATVVAVPAGLTLGHLGKGAFAASSLSNVGRAVPALVLVLFFSSFLGLGVTNLVFGMTLLAIPPIFLNAYVGVRQVDPEVVDAARGVGLSGLQVVRQVELPLALPLIFGGVRTSVVNVLATATLGPLAGVVTLGDPIINASVYGEDGRLGAAIVIAVLAVAAEAILAGVQRAVTPRGLKIADDEPRGLSALRRRGVATPTPSSP